MSKENRWLTWRSGTERQETQEYIHTPGKLDLIPEADTKQRCHRRGRRSRLLVRLRRRVKVQSLDNKVDEIRARFAFQRDIRDCNILCFTEHGSLGICCQSRYRHRIYSCIALTETNISLVRRRAWVYALMINDSWCNHNNIQFLLVTT
jgi:hypothetical protein